MNYNSQSYQTIQTQGLTFADLILHFVKYPHSLFLFIESFFLLLVSYLVIFFALLVIIYSTYFLIVPTDNQTSIDTKINEYFAPDYNKNVENIFSLQLGNYKNKLNAEKHINALKLKNENMRLEMDDSGNFIVLLDYFTTKNEASIAKSAYIRNSRNKSLSLNDTPFIKKLK